MSRLLKQVLLGYALLFALPAHVMADALSDAQGAFDAGDYAKAATLYLPLAKQGNAVAQFNLGVVYSQGLVFLQDDREAIQWYLLAANQGYAPAQVKLGVLYAQGQAVKQDYKKAVQWFQLAADQNDASAKLNLGEMYAQGHGVLQDHQKAMQWYFLAADQGNALAQYKLGQSYIDGQGVTPNIETAYLWFNLAAGNATDAVTHKKYIEQRDLVANQLSELKIAKAQQAAKLEALAKAEQAAQTESARIKEVQAAQSEASGVVAEKAAQVHTEATDKQAAAVPVVVPAPLATPPVPEPEVAPVPESAIEPAAIPAPEPEAVPVPEPKEPSATPAAVSEINPALEATPSVPEVTAAPVPDFAVEPADVPAAIPVPEPVEIPILIAIPPVPEPVVVPVPESAVAPAAVLSAIPVPEPVAIPAEPVVVPALVATLLAPEPAATPVPESAVAPAAVLSAIPVPEPVAIPAAEPVVVPALVATPLAPEPAAAPVPETRKTLPESKPVHVEVINFVSGSDKLKPSAGEKLNEVVRFTDQYPIAKLESVGHTDNLGSIQQNIRLSLKRAESVKKYLVEKGVASNRVIIKGQGPFNPIADNMTEEGRAQNRRVEIRSVIEETPKVRREKSAPASIPAPEPAAVPVPKPIEPVAVPAARPAVVPALVAAPSVPIPKTAAVPAPVVAPALEPVAASATDIWKTLLENKPVRIEEIDFVPGTDKLTPTADKQLNEVVQFAAKYPDAKLELIGHTDNLEPVKKNLRLSLNRAESVKKYLVKQGVATNRVITKSQGSHNPIADNSTEEGRTKNRRVDIHSITNNTPKALREKSAPASIPAPEPAAVPVPKPAAAPAARPAVVPALVAAPSVPIPKTAAVPAPVVAPALEPVAASATDIWKTLLENKPVRIEEIDFVPGSDKLKPTADKQLNEVVQFAAKYPDAKLELIGHTDNLEPVKKNLRLSLNRAESVKKYLVKQGVATSRVITKSQGSHNPIADNSTEEGRTKNRRVEIRSVIEETPKVRREKPALEPSAASISAQASETWKILQKNKPVRIEEINFVPGSARLMPAAYKILNEVVTAAKMDKKSSLMVTGYYVDESSLEKVAGYLSAARAGSVREYLVKKGIAADRITAAGKGMADPVGDNKTEKGRAQNRRVEIRWAHKEAE